MIFKIEQTNDVKSTNVKYGKNRLETLLNRYKGAELMFLSIDCLSLTISRLSVIFNIGLSHLINNLSVISNRCFLFSWVKLLKLSKDGKKSLRSK